jgi:GntR family transcriptional regulator
VTAATVDPHSAIPLHLQVQSIVRRMVGQRPYRDGAVLPDEITLAERLRVGRGTVRQAIAALVSEGLLVRRRGIGTRKAPTPITGDLAAFRSFSREMAGAGVSVRLIAATLDIVTADAEVADALGLVAGTEVVHLLRVRGDDDGPIASFASWLHPVCGLRRGDDLAQPLYDLIGSRGGPQPATSSEALQAVIADRSLAANLGCAVGAPVLERRRRVCAADGACFEFAIVHYRSDRFRLHLAMGGGEV